jgi:cytoskeletal protein RodZ
MINLLPEAERQKLLLAKKEKLAIIWGIVVLVFLVCMTLILLSIKFYILAETDYQKNILESSEKTDQTSNFTSLNSTVKKYNVTLSKLSSFYKKEIYFNQTLKIVEDVPSPEGLRLTNFSLTRNAAGNVQVSVTGVSVTRDDLITFKNNIELDKQIKNPVFSSESWINPKNANFSLTFEIDQNEK